MKAIGIIPARWGSTRFPGKSLAPLCGKPLLQWVFERARQATGLSAVWIATDDDRIRRAAEAFGAKVAMTRSDHPSGTDRVAEAAAAARAEIVVNIQGDEPTIDPALIDRLVSALRTEPGWDMATAAAPMAASAEASRSSVCKVVFGGNGQALYFSRAAIPCVRDRDFTPPAGLPLYWRHIGIYLYRREFLARLVAEPPCLLERAECLEQLRALHLGARIKVVTTAEVGLGVDTPEDVAAAEKALRSLGLAR